MKYKVHFDFTAIGCKEIDAIDEEQASRKFWAWLDGQDKPTTAIIPLTPRLKNSLIERVADLEDREYEVIPE